MTNNTVVHLALLLLLSSFAKADSSLPEAPGYFRLTDAPLSSSVNWVRHLVKKSHCVARSETLFNEASGQVLRVNSRGSKVYFNGNETTLRQVVLSASPGATILLEDGVYEFKEAGAGEYTGLYVTANNITLRSASGNPYAVILDSAYVEHGNQSALITVAASGFKLADLTLKRSLYHLVHAWADADEMEIHNVRFEDGGQQFLKASAGNSSAQIDSVKITCSEFMMTPTGRNNVWGYGASNGWTRCYTGGIDAHRSSNWLIADNRFEGIYCDDQVPHPAHGRNGQLYVGGLAEHAIHLWHSDQNTEHVIERNQIHNCARGIGVGSGNNPQAGRVVIKNNMVSSIHAGSAEHDVGIIVEAISRAEILHNTVVFTHSNAYSAGIEYRFNATNADINANLVSGRIRQRDGANASQANNSENASIGLFNKAESGDLHISSCSAAMKFERNESGVVGLDFDGEHRLNKTATGADEC